MNEHQPSAPLEEGKDFYIENGLYVFTEYYLLQRGYCCQSGCRHCPYGFLKPTEDHQTLPVEDSSSEKK